MVRVDQSLKMTKIASGRKGIHAILTTTTSRVTTSQRPHLPSSRHVEGSGPLDWAAGLEVSSHCQRLRWHHVRGSLQFGLHSRQADWQQNRWPTLLTCHPMGIVPILSK